MKTRYFRGTLDVSTLTAPLVRQLRYEAGSTGITTGDAHDGKLEVWAHPQWLQDVYDLATRWGITAEGGVALLDI